MNLYNKQRLLPEAISLLGAASKLSLKARIAPSGQAKRTGLCFKYLSNTG